MKNHFSLILKNCLFILVGILCACAVGEALIRLGTSNQDNYVIEMWRYAKLLKKQSENDAVGHEHIPNKRATLQHVDVDINDLGMRGPMPDPSVPHRVALIGDSLVFGWGVEDKHTMRGYLSRLLPDSIDVVNAGVGNMNLNQSVSHWLDLSQKVNADMLVVYVTPRAASKMQEDNCGWLVRNSRLAAISSTFFRQLKSGAYGENKLIEEYRHMWTGPQGRDVLTHAFEKLSTYQKAYGCRIVIVSIPETHDFNNYQFPFMAETAGFFARKYGFPFIDALPLLQGPPTKSFWVSERDIHLNGKAFQLISSALEKMILEAYENTTRS